MRPIFLITSLFCLLLSGCFQEEIELGEKVSDLFYLENKKASMRVLVEGNTLSNKFVIYVHGGPGASSYLFNTEYLSENLESDVAVVYFDQRNAGASQGGSNGDELSLDQLINDLEKLIGLIKHRYGAEVDIYLLAHSFGGMVSSGFMTKGNNQELVDGWIMACTAHNYRLSDSLARVKLMDRGTIEIDKGNNADLWREIIDYVEPLEYDMSLEESNQLNSYSHEVESFFVERINTIAEVNRYPIPTTAVLLNSVYSSNASLTKDLLNIEFSSQLNSITKPVLLLFGENDFVCPSGLGLDIFNNIGTPASDKKLVISDVSGHDIFYQDEVLFSTEIKGFVAAFD